jgi:hypothetical protein
LLLHLRRAHFGELLQAESACPSCGELLEYELHAQALAGPLPWPLQELPALAVSLEGLSLHLRRPHSEDLLRAADAAALMRRCLLDDDEGARACCEQSAWQQAFGAALAQDDPRIDPQIGLVCPACGAGWEVTFDIATFMAADLRALGARLLDEVHVLALAYHWSEREILELPATRRRHYLRKLSS